VDVLTKGMDKCNEFNNSKYQSMVNNAILTAEQSKDNDGDPWSVNFSSNSVDVEWVDLFEQLGLSEYDFAHEQLDIEACIVRWKKLIEDKAVDAKEFITSQKTHLLKYDTEETDISKEKKQEIETEIQELDAISGLIDDDIQDYITMTESATDIDDLIEIWPPILLPMPYRKELVRVPTDLATNDLVNDVENESIPPVEMIEQVDPESLLLPSSAEDGYTRYKHNIKSIPIGPKLAGNSKTVSLQYRIPTGAEIKDGVVWSIGGPDVFKAVRISIDQDQPTFEFFRGKDGEWVSIINSKIVLTPGKWYTITTTYDKTMGVNCDADQCRFYVNGDDEHHVRLPGYGDKGFDKHTAPIVETDEFTLAGYPNNKGYNTGNIGDYRHVRIYQGKVAQPSELDPASDHIPAGATEILLYSENGSLEDRSI
jgi:hypothetical protein